MNPPSTRPALDSDRDQTNLESFIAPVSEIGGLKMRPFSAGTLTLCRALGLKMVTGASKEELDALSMDEKQRQLTAFLFIQSAPLDLVKKAAKVARENRTAFEDDYLLPFELELPVEAMMEAVQQIEAHIEAVAAAQVEVVPRESGRSQNVPTAPPN